MIRIMHVSSEGMADMDYPLEKLAGALATPHAITWVDIMGEPPETCGPLFRNVFHFHPLSIEDALHDHKMPKIDDWGDYVYISLQSVVFGGGPDFKGLEKYEGINIFKGHHFIITHHENPVPAIDREWDLCAKDDRHTNKGSSKWLYHILDGVVDDFMTAMDYIDEAVSGVEDEIFRDPQKFTIERIFVIKRIILHLRRILSPTREVLNKMARDSYSAIDPKNRIYYRDVYDHFVRLFELNESLRDLVAGAMDMYLSVSSSKTNNIMKLLTIVTTLFMPLSFLTGFWGMNFFNPEPNIPFCNYGVFAGTLLVMIILPGCMLLWMRFRKWL